MCQRGSGTRSLVKGSYMAGVEISKDTSGKVAASLKARGDISVMHLSLSNCGYIRNNCGYQRVSCNAVLRRKFTN
jgi:hypothetical protein